MRGDAVKVMVYYLPPDVNVDGRHSSSFKNLPVGFVFWKMEMW